MQIISKVERFPEYSFSVLEPGAVFQRQDSRKLYLKTRHSVEGANAVRLSNGLASTLKDDEVVIVRDDACVRFDVAEG